MPASTSADSTTASPGGQDAAEASATVTIRPITYAEINALAARDAAPVQVYVASESRRHGLTFTPATLTPKAKTGRAYEGTDVPHETLYAAVPNDSVNASPGQWREDKSRPVGHVISCDFETMFGTHSGGWLFTSPEAETTAADVRGYTDPTHTRLRVFVEDSKAGRAERLTPVFGSQVSTGFIVEGIDADEARARAEAALRAEFGDALRTNAKSQSRPVPDRRVNLYTVGDREVLALNVLDSEVSYYMRSNAVDVEEVDPSAPTPVVGA